MGNLQNPSVPFHSHPEKPPIAPDYFSTCLKKYPVFWLPRRLLHPLLPRGLLEKAAAKIIHSNVMPWLSLNPLTESILREKMFNRGEKAPFRTEFLLSYILEARSTYRYPLSKHLLKHSWLREVGIKESCSDHMQTLHQHQEDGLCLGQDAVKPCLTQQINGLRGTGSIHQRSSPNSSCKHKNDDI